MLFIAYNGRAVRRVVLHDGSAAGWVLFVCRIEAMIAHTIHPHLTGCCSLKAAQSLVNLRVHRVVSGSTERTVLCWRGFVPREKRGERRHHEAGVISEIMKHTLR